LIFDSGFDKMSTTLFLPNGRWCVPQAPFPSPGDDGEESLNSPTPVTGPGPDADDGEGLAALSDDQLLGIISATRRMESRIAWTQLDP
jgi:hypothetical protein